MALTGLMAALLAPLMLLGWSHDRTVEPPLPQRAVGVAPSIGTAARWSHTEIRVLTYNVEGLPWPIRADRTPHLDRIGDALAVLRRQGNAPHLVLIQEAFTGSAGAIARRSGYPNFLRGPSAWDRFTPAERAPIDHVLAQPIWMRGEQIGKFVSSGLYILSEFPILAKNARPFGEQACAGYDCLANKGVLLGRIEVPGLPEPIEIATTHLNAQGASGVPRGRTHLAHHRQIDQLAEALEEWRTPGGALIIGGDFNVRRAPVRFDYATTRQKALLFARPWCVQTGRRCRIDVPSGSGQFWLDTQDLQAFASGTRIIVEPVHLEHLFDGSNGPRLSDHAGYMVTYRLTWRDGLEHMEQR